MIPWHGASRSCETGFLYELATYTYYILTILYLAKFFSCCKLNGSRTFASGLACFRAPSPVTVEVAAVARAVVSVLITVVVEEARFAIILMAEGTGAPAARVSVLETAGTATPAVFGSVLVTAGLPSISKSWRPISEIPAISPILFCRCTLGCWTVGGRGMPTPRPTVGRTVVAVGLTTVASAGPAALVYRQFMAIKQPKCPVEQRIYQRY